MDTSIRNDGQLFLDFAWGQFVTSLQRGAEMTGVPNLEQWRPMFHVMFRVILEQLTQYQLDSTVSRGELFASGLKAMSAEVCRREVADHKAWADRATRRNES
jgi:hypothetical protein